MTALAEASRRASAPAEPAVLIKDVYKSFPAAYGLAAWIRSFGRIPRREVLHRINLTVGRGELLGVLGPNGAGKTTLLKALATLLLPDRGQIIIDGVDVMTDSLSAKRKIGLCISEERSFYFRLTARANLEFFAALYGLRGAAMRRRVEAVAEQVDLVDMLDRRFAELSSGMRQRMTIARALLGDPTIVLLDEPTRAVDPVHAEEIRRFIRHQLVEQLGKTVILATNLLDEAWRLCDRIAVVNDGLIVALGPPGSLDDSLRRVDRYTITLDRLEHDLRERIGMIPGVTLDGVSEDEAGVTLTLEIAENPAALTAVCGAVTASGALLRGFTTIAPSPVDVFQHVTRAND
jgi:ABC-2 type transport system ATP-binding protein